MSNNGVESHNKDLEATVTNPGGAGRQRVGELIKNLFNFLRRKSILIDPTSAGYNPEYAYKMRAVISRQLYTKGESITTNPNWVFAGPFINGPAEEYIMYSKNFTDSTVLSHAALVQLHQRAALLSYRCLAEIANEQSYLCILSLDPGSTSYSCSCSYFSTNHVCKHATALGIRQKLILGYERPLSSKKVRGRPSKAKPSNDLFPKKRRLDTTFVQEGSMTQVIITDSDIRRVNSGLRHKNTKVFDL